MGRRGGAARRGPSRSILPTEISAVISLHIVCPRVTAKRISDKTATARPHEVKQERPTAEPPSREDSARPQPFVDNRGGAPKLHLNIGKITTSFKKEQLPWWRGGEVNKSATDPIWMREGICDGKYEAHSDTATGRPTYDVAVCWLAGTP